MERYRVNRLNLFFFSSIKPIIFIYTNEMSQNYPRSVENIKFFAEEFGTKAINIDNNKKINFNDYLKINQKKYDEYFSKYILNNKNNNLLFWEKVIFELENKAKNF